MVQQFDEAALGEAVSKAEERYEGRNPRSRARWEAACDHLPGGNTRSVLYCDPFPLTFVRGEGATLWDADGNQYRDFLNEYGAGIYGHSDPVIDEAIRTTLAEGIALGGLNLHEAELARLIRERFPSCDQVRFCNSATEANLYALSLARIATGRPEIMVFDGGYHGGNLAFTARENPMNVPYTYRYGTYNDIEATLGEMRRSSDALAAVIVEPMMAGGGGIPAEAAFLHALRDEATRLGVILILDEAMTSRMSPGGLQAYHGITPDMTTFGKYLGGGLASGVFGGRADIMRLIDSRNPKAVAHAGTFNNNVLAMAAGAAGMREVFTADAARILHERGDRLRKGLTEAGERSAVPVQVTGIGSLMAIHLQSGSIRCPGDVQMPDAARKLLQLELANRGFHIARRGYLTLSLPVSDDDCRVLVDAFEDVLTLFEPIYARSAVIA
uniref:aspartate aminotransferase family protein n=1 Tax=Sphingomonas bacterium TaxID=1895847 RepID=UPI00262B5F76|nr:aminotransferase class III-fold pyridoxal phosphate-dependent enzyme [Sphingomonas bacterium]